MSKAKKVFVRYGHGDTLLSIDDYHAGKEPSPGSYYFIGFEDEDGRECKEDGTYLNQKKNEQ